MPSATVPGHHSTIGAILNPLLFSLDTNFQVNLKIFKIIVVCPNQGLIYLIIRSSCKDFVLYRFRHTVQLCRPALESDWSQSVMRNPGSAPGVCGEVGPETGTESRGVSPPGNLGID
jgi:hypothetical protein